VYEFCTPELQQKLRRNRDLASRRFEEELKAKQNAGAAITAAMEIGVSEPEPMTTIDAVIGEDGGFASVSAMEIDDEEAALRAALAMSVEGSAAAHVAEEAAKEAVTMAVTQGEVITPGLPSGWTGTYELHGIVTHKGRDADSGHYIGWVRQAPGSRFWWKYDDDKVSEVDTEEIMTLKGGGDKDMAYLVFYRAKL
jgi:hypothetical protein